VLLMEAPCLVTQAEATRLAALAWAAGLLGRARRPVLAHTPLLLPPLLAALSAPSPAVATKAVRVLVRGCTTLRAERAKTNNAAALHCVRYSICGAKR